MEKVSTDKHHGPCLKAGVFQEKNTEDLAGGVIMGLVNLHFILLKVNRA